MTPDQITYLVFGIVIVLSIVIDLGMFTRKGATISLKMALWTSIFWIALGLAFGIFVWYEKGYTSTLEYYSAYLMEKSLSIDNIFVFVLIFSVFGIKEEHLGRALFIGVLMAIILRIIFITVGVALVEKFEWILYIFGAFLVYTGIKMLRSSKEEEFDPHKNPAYKFMKRVLPLVPHDGGGRYFIREKGKRFYTTLFVVVVLLAVIDIVFAVDSIPAVMGISRDKLIIYTSNIFAVLGLRSLFFLLRGAANKFVYLQQGIAVVLIFIGLKMLAEIFHFDVPIYISMMVIVICIAGSIFYSIQYPPEDEEKEPAQE
jgi:tellurite resistance protein TerC